MASSVFFDSFSGLFNYGTLSPSIHLKYIRHIPVFPHSHLPCAYSHNSSSLSSELLPHFRPTDTYEGEPQDLCICPGRWIGYGTITREMRNWCFLSNSSTRTSLWSLHFFFKCYLNMFLRNSHDPRPFHLFATISGIQRLCFFRFHFFMFLHEGKESHERIQKMVKSQWLTHASRIEKCTKVERYSAIERSLEGL